MHVFEGILFFKATNDTKANELLSCCLLGASTKTLWLTGLKAPTN